MACDGHSYERTAIESVIRSGNGLSPLTREPLQQHLFPNRALKRRIEEHEEDVLRAAATAVANAATSASADGEQGPAASGDPAPKRSRRHA